MPLWVCRSKVTGFKENEIERYRLPKEGDEEDEEGGFEEDGGEDARTLFLCRI